MYIFKQFILCWAFTIVMVTIAHTQQIQINQIGYISNAPKIAAVTNYNQGTRFYLTTLATGDTVFTGNLSAANLNASLARSSETPSISNIIRPG